MTETPAIYALLAEFDSADGVLAAAKAVHEAGYQRAEAYTPFPVEGLAEALGFHKTRIPAITLCGGIFGGLGGFFMCWYANVISYPWNIGGRPHNSWPAWIPITFEMTVLFAALSAAIGMLIHNGLPRLHHPLFEAPTFLRASRDRFFLAIEATDERFEEAETTRLLQGLGAVSVSIVPAVGGAG